MSCRCAWLLAAGLVPAAAFAQPAPAQKPAPAPAAKAADDTVDTVVVTAAPTEEVRTSIDRRSYSVGKEVAASAGTLADLLRTVPSVDVDPQGNVSLRGDAGVTITVDGKPAGVFRGEARAQAIQSLPADQYDRVEVITNPSAADSAEGTAGVINLVSKTARKAGRSGSLRASVGTAGQYTAGGGLNYNSGKLSVNANASYRTDRQAFGSTDTRQEISPAGVQTAHFIDQRINGRLGILNASLGVDYDIDAKTRVGFQSSFFTLDAIERAVERFEDRDALGRSIFSVREMNRSPFSNEGPQASLTLRRKFDGDQELTAELRRDRSPGHINRPDRIYVLPAGPETFGLLDTRLVIQGTGAKLNYKRSLAGGEFKSGYELRIDESRSRTLIARGPRPDVLMETPGFAGAFDYRAEVNAGFATYQHAWGDLTALAGLRLEDARVTIGGPSITERTTDRLDPFPSLHLTYDLGGDRKLSASYSRRIMRPTAFMLSPAPSFQNDRAVQRGNPDLKPPQTDSFEAGYETRGKAGAFTTTLYWRITHDDISALVRELDGGVLLTTVENLGTGRRGGASVSVNRKLTGTLTANLSGDLFWREVSPSRAQGERRSGVSGAGRASLSWQATPADLIQLDIRGILPTPLAQGERTASTALNFGYRRRLRPDLFFVVTGQNLLGRQTQADALRSPTLNYRRTFYGPPALVTFGLNYTFGGKAQPPPAFEFGAGGAPPS